MAYSSQNANFPNKYDLNNDVDDRTFLANSKSNSRPNYNQPLSAKEEFERKQQLILKQKAKLEDSCLSSAQNSLHLINESEQIGIKTGVELMEQREKLDRTNRHLDTMAGLTRISQKHIRGLNSGVGAFVVGGIKNMFRKEKPDKTDQYLEPKLTSSQSANNFQATSQLNNTLNQLRSNSTQYEPNQMNQFANREPGPVKQDFNSKLDAHLLDMQSGIGRLKNLALGLGNEIDQQNETLDIITKKTDQTDITLKVQNKSLLKKLGN